MKPLLSSTVAFIVGCVLWWLGVHLDGFLAAQSWPAFVVALSKRSTLQALYFWQVAVYFVPMFLAVCAGGYALFRVVGASAAALFAAFVPYILLNWVMRSFEMLFHWSGLSSYGLLLIAQSAFPLGLLVGWQLVRRGNLTPPSSGQPPAGFAV